MKMSYVGGRSEFNKDISYYVYSSVRYFGQYQDKRKYIPCREKIPIAKFIVKKLGTGSQIKEGF